MFNKATICSLIGSVGVVVTSVLAVKCYKNTTPDDDLKTKAVKYIPAVLSGGVSIGCILAADKINKKEIAAVTASAAYFAQKFQDYEKEVREIVGDEKADEIQESFYSKQLDNVENQNLPKFIDKFSGAPIIASYEDVVKGLEKCEKYYKETGLLAWCDLFYCINGSFDAYDSYLGETVGWSKDMYRQFYEEYEDYSKINFKLKELGDNKYLIDYYLLPEFGFMEY